MVVHLRAIQFLIAVHEELKPHELANCGEIRATFIDTCMTELRECVQKCEAAPITEATVRALDVPQTLYGVLLLCPMKASSQRRADIWEIVSSYF